MDRWHVALSVAVAFLAGCVVALLCMGHGRSAPAAKEAPKAPVRRALHEDLGELDVLRRAQEHALKTRNDMIKLAHSAHGSSESSPVHFQNRLQCWVDANETLERMFWGAVNKLGYEYRYKARYLDPDKACKGRFIQKSKKVREKTDGAY